MKKASDYSQVFGLIPRIHMEILLELIEIWNADHSVWRGQLGSKLTEE